MKKVQEVLTADHIQDSETSLTPPKAFSASPADMFELVKAGADADAITKLWEVQKEWKSSIAKEQFDAAFAQFKADAPKILKTKHVSFPTSGGGKTDYWHAELDKISDIIGESLNAVGIIQTWRSSELNGKTTVTCILKGFGHTEEGSTLSGPADTSGGKNSIQAIGSTNFYLQRYTLLSTCGLVPKGADDDGKTEGMSEEAITDYCIQMQDDSNFDDLKKHFAECWEKAKNAKDQSAKDRLRKVYENRKRELSV